ncbi:Uma2 family endonuclease [Peterkaempfera griseoplana]|uniref:Uma2 family endonuclease n=1 Tax=Peterkaempfera griseoplana TaxID=66896 RepID=UPI0006E1C8E5|nr:Uma2 family endonuclease [Peterkaempfera griseoplana]
MTAVDDRVIRVFEDLVVPEGFKAELIRGEIVMMAGPDLVHNMIVTSIMDQIPPSRWLRVQTQDIAIPAETSLPQPDLVVLEHGAQSRGRLVPSSAVTLVVEVVSATSRHRDCKEKREIYSAGGIPVYLIVDPVLAKCVLLTDPMEVSASGRPDYQDERTARFGAPLPVPALDLTLDTSGFQTISPAP